ncbi:hypothetical protein ABC795_03355 [Blastococcus sp. HT6-30]|uniref:hypothetical protein n=1 Tax=Blastococcus sp. HT6-30 TaxID=3144843 RepID=UPI00321A4425
MTAVGPVRGTASADLEYRPHPPPSDGRGSSGGSDRHRPPSDWQQALSDLEGDVLAVEHTLARGRTEEIAAWGQRAEDWVPPAQLGPIPADLRERAASLLQHQLEVAEQLIERITQSQKQRDVAARMSYGPIRPVASFVDRAL